MNQLYYLCFSVNKLPDLTLSKYSVFDGSSVDNIMEKHGVFLRQLHRLGYSSGVYFHLLYFYNPDRSIPKGKHLTIIFYATSQNKEKLDGIREFLTTSVLSNYYDFYCYEVAKEFTIEEEHISDGTNIPILKLVNISGTTKKYGLGNTNIEDVFKARERIENGIKTHISCEIASDANAILSFDNLPVDETGKIITQKKFKYGAFLTKKDYSLPAQNRLNTDNAGEVALFSIMEWEPCDKGRLFNVLKLMEGYDRDAVLRIDIFPVEHTQSIRQRLPYPETRRRVSDRSQGKDDNSESIIRSWDRYLSNLMKFPQFLANIVALADSQDVAVMLADSVAAEAVESGTYLVETMYSKEGFDLYVSDAKILHADKDPNNYVASFLSLYTLEEIRPMFSFPILYPGESIECRKETDPIPFPKEVTIDKDTGEKHEVVSLGTSSLGYDVTFPVALFKKHAFIAGVPGSGKTNTMLYLVTSLWKNIELNIPFLVLEPAKQEYRALALIDGMEDLCIFSPGADTYFPLHINPFEFPIGLTLAEHIANLNQVFSGAFQLDPPTPFLLDSSIERVYIDKGWNINERNNGDHEYPTMQDLYDALKVIMDETGYDSETKSNIRSVIEVRIGSLIRREVGNVYNVKKSIINPEDWLDVPVVIELEALGEGPANFMSLLISTLIREVLKVKKTSFNNISVPREKKKEVKHIIFYEEAHNLIGPTTDDPVGGIVNPKISATKYLVKMLAEVRALGEGIVIADQLPTVMAPEVLKNTGLKIGHRITARDDRNLLGSTMSASPDQLEEQGTFEIGQALVFYEGLLKPFKMQINEWEKTLPRKKYDSPSNEQLFEHLKHNKRYNDLLNRSAIIMQEKMITEFDVLRDYEKKLEQQIQNSYSEVIMHEDNIEVLKKKLSRLTLEDEISNTKKNILTEKGFYEKKRKEFKEKYTRELKRLCWKYINLYYANMTLSKNYYTHTGDMYMCTIKNYLSVFSIVNSLRRIEGLNDIIVCETEKVMNDILKYVDYNFCSSSVVLKNHVEYNNVLFECGDYIVCYLDSEFDKLALLAEKIQNSTFNTEDEVIEYAKCLSSLYFRYFDVAEKYYNVGGLLIDNKNMFVKVSEKFNSIETDADEKSWIYEKEKMKIFLLLADKIASIGRSVSTISGSNRAVFLTNISEMLASYRSIVDYRNFEVKTKLSSLPDYKKIWENTNDLLKMEMDSKFEYLHQKRLSTIELFTTYSPEESKGLIKKLASQYNGLFRCYSVACSNSNKLKNGLVEHYIKYLEEILKMEKSYHSVIIETSDGNWKTCSKFMKELISSKEIEKAKISRWNKLSVMMKDLFE